MNVKLKGNTINLKGTFPKKGDKIKDFVLTNTDLNDVSLKDFSGKKKLLNIFPSLDTSVCATSVRKFNVSASKLNNTVVLCISADLPFAHKRFCTTEGINDVINLSCFRNKDFAIDNGVSIIDSPLAGLTARSVIVLDENDNVIYSELVEEISNEPNYDLALKAIS